MTTEINTSVSTRTYDDLLIPGHLPLTDYFTLASGQSVVRGQVLAYDSNKKLTSYDEQAASPQNVAEFVAFEDVDATAGDKSVGVYIKAVLRKAKVVFGNTGDYESAAYDDLRKRGIHLHGSSTDY